MRTAFFEENGIKHMAVLSFTALEEILQKFDDLNKVDKALEKDSTFEQFEICAFVLEVLMRNGDAYAKEMGIENPKPLTKQQIYTRCSPEDVVNMAKTIKDCFKNGKTREIEVENPNTTAAQK